jgi:uncharacterized protein YqjF (DUF2071 family)
LHFLETNVRTYVHIDGREPGVYFFSLDAASALAVAGARISLGLPYFLARGEEHLSESAVEYHLKRVARGSPACHVSYAAGARIGAAEPGSLDYFLIERYTLHVRRGGTLWTVRVKHAPYPLRRSTLLKLVESITAADGLPKLGVPSLTHFSPGVDVAVFPPAIRPIRRSRVR